jgi:putative exporter of polyketide antibiotics
VVPGVWQITRFTHILRVGGGSFSPVPLLWLLAIGAALTRWE